LVFLIHTDKIGVCFVGPNHSQSEFSQKYRLIHAAAHISFFTSANTEDTKQPDAFFQTVPSRNIQRRCFELWRDLFLPYSFHSSPWIILTFQNTESTLWDTQITSELQSLHSEKHRLGLSYRVYTLRHTDYFWARVYTLRNTDYVWATESTLWDTQITSELRSLHSLVVELELIKFQLNNESGRQ